MQTCVINLLIGLIPGSRIDNWGHLGGAVAGAAMGYLIGPNLVRAGFGYADRPLVPLGFSK
jgi:membrane associated rhomboid family serine protease